MPIPKYPVLFYKPVTALGGPYDPVPVHAMAQEEEGLDYECELMAVIGKRCTDVSEADALNYVLGYSVGNDISHRDWQIKRGGGQWGLGKGFNGWAPWGPGIVSSSLIKDPQNLNIKTVLNGNTVQVRLPKQYPVPVHNNIKLTVLQDSNTSDMIFSVAKAISFLSKGTTLLPGDVIMTGTPQGVGAGRSPPLWLKDGDICEVSLEGVGTIVNKVEFEDTKSNL